MLGALDIPKRPFGRSGIPVSILGFGGWHLGVPKTDQEAIRLLHAALDAGITFLDNAWDYNDGLSEARMGKGLLGRRDQAFLMTKVCTHGRGARVAMRQLEDSLRRLRTEYLDLWQVHEVVFDDEPARHFARGGVVEALDRARQQGKVRFTGFTGHKDPRLHLEMLSHDYPWDACWEDYCYSVINLLFFPVHQWHIGLPARIWWLHVERGMAAFEDLGCAELLTR